MTEVRSFRDHGAAQLKQEAKEYVGTVATIASTRLAPGATGGAIIGGRAVTQVAKSCASKVSKEAAKKTCVGVLAILCKDQAGETAADTVLEHLSTKTAISRGVRSAAGRGPNITMPKK